MHNGRVPIGFKMKCRTLLFILGILFGFVFDETSGWWVFRRRRRRCYPSNCRVSGWSWWTGCTQSCGSHGVQSRDRYVTAQASCGGGCWHLSESRSCNRVCCPVNCTWSWGNWGACKGCDIGNRTRIVVVSMNPSCGGVPCPSVRNESQPCNTTR